jgi:RNA polymerase sigma factor (sigma-70 family)
MSPDSGNADSGNDNPRTHGVGPDTTPGAKPDASSDTISGTKPGTKPDTRPGTKNVSRFLADHQPLVANLYVEAGSYPWSLPRERFEAALERSAAKRFGSQTVSPEEIEEYLGALHLQDLSLAAACAEGNPEAWEHFVATYRSYLRSAAAAILRCPASSPAARDLADSLFADLYGLTDAKRGERSLYRYFHGRSSLKTWLRAVLAQRHIDAIRATRRFTELDDDASGSNTQDISRRPLAPARIQTLPDPHRERYVALFTRTLQVALGLLDPRDSERLRLYYADQQTLAEIGRKLGEHESSVSRNLDRIRRELRAEVERALRNPSVTANGLPAEPGLGDDEISLCFEYASEDAPIDLDKLFPGGGPIAERLEP